MRSVSFGSVHIGQRFLYDEVWYVKISAKVISLHDMFNALELYDQRIGAWFDDHDTVEIDESIRTSS